MPLLYSAANSNASHDDLDMEAGDNRSPSPRSMIEDGEDVEVVPAGGEIAALESFTSSQHHGATPVKAREVDIENPVQHSTSDLKAALALDAEDYEEQRLWFLISSTVSCIAVFTGFLTFVVIPWIVTNAHPGIGSEGYTLQSYSLWMAGLAKGGSTSYFFVSSSCTVSACSAAKDAGTCVAAPIPQLAGECASYNVVRAFQTISVLLASASSAIGLYMILSRVSFSDRTGRKMEKMSMLCMAVAALSSLIAFSVFMARLYFAGGGADAASIHAGMIPFIMCWPIMMAAAASIAAAFYAQKKQDSLFFHGQAPPPSRNCPEIGFI